MDERQELDLLRCGLKRQDRVIDLRTRMNGAVTTIIRFIQSHATPAPLPSGCHPTNDRPENKRLSVTNSDFSNLRAFFVGGKFGDRSLLRLISTYLTLHLTPLPRIDCAHLDPRYAISIPDTPYAISIPDTPYAISIPDAISISRETHFEFPRDHLGFPRDHFEFPNSSASRQPQRSRRPGYCFLLPSP
jgi:hypothetical protein